MLLLDPAIDLGYIPQEDGTVAPVMVETHIDDAQALLIPYLAEHDQWQQIEAIIGERAQLYETAILSVLSMLSYGGAGGFWLALDAENMGVGRDNWTDAQFRRLRDARRHVNHGSGTWEKVVRVPVEGMNAVGGTFARCGAACIYAGILLDYVPDLDFQAEIGRYFCNDSIQDGVVPAGVGYGLTVSQIPAFRLDIGLGLDQGGLAEVVVQS